MNKKVTKLLFWVMFFCVLSESFGQLYISQQKYSSTAFTVFNVNSSCYGSGLEMYINNVKVTNFTYGLCNYGICQFRFPFGTMKVGDVLLVKDACGNSSTPMTIEDDYVYIEVPGGASFSGNSIDATDESLPYDKLSSAIQIGKCEPAEINSHALHKFDFFASTGLSSGTYSTGVIKLNGTPITTAMVTIDKLGNNSTTATHNNGILTYNGAANVFINQSFSGRTPTTIEYQHNGVLPFQDQEFGLGPLRVRQWRNNETHIYEYKYDGSITTTILNGNYSASNFKITFDLGFFKLYIDNVEVYSIRRSVIYSASSGTVSNGALLDYGTAINWTPGSSGNQWVGAMIDGIRYTRQSFNVAEDISINQTVTNVACNGQSTGSVTINATGGQNPLQYSKDGISFSGNNTFSGLAAGNYTFYVRDASGCQTSKDISVSENSPISISVSSKSNANCAGQANGSATLSANGGAGFYEYGYSDANYQSSSTISNLTSGSYVFWVKDAAGCKASLADQIGLNSSLNVSISSKQNLLCFNDNTGTVTLANTGSNAGPVTYSKDGLVFQNTPVFGGLAAGNYTFTLKDNLCTVTISENISEPSLLSLSGNIDNQVSCYGGSNAKITVNQNGGTSPYTFSSDDSNYTTSNVFDNLPIGNYKYWVKDQNGCKASTSIFTITQPSDIVFSVSSKTDISCFGGNDGEVTLNTTGGVASYQYTIDNTNYQSSNTFSGLNFGLKTFGVKDQNGCVKTTNTTLLQPTALQLSISQSNNLVCNNDNTGQVTLLSSGGTTPYTYFKDNAFGQSTSAFTGLAAGSYVFSAKDAKNCEVILSSITLTQPTPIQISQILKTDINCETYADGALGFVASGSNGGFNYTLSGKDFKLNDIGTLSAANGQFNNLKAGNYVLTATDQFACAKTYDAAIVPKNSGIRFDVNTTLPSSCLAADGGIAVTNIRGGRPNPSYSIKLSGQNAFGSQTSFNNLINGNYFVTVADEFCSYNQEVSLKLASSLSANYSISPLSCTSPNANVNVEPISGGSGNYQLAINRGAFSADRNFNNLTPNTYGIIIKDSPLTCQTTLSFEIKEQNRADLKTSQVQDISCFEGSDGYIQAIGDNNLSPFTYSFNNLSSFGSNNNFGGLPIGTYRIYAKNSIGCLDSIRVTLNQPTKILWDVSIKNNDCFGDQTGAIAINGNGGTPPYQYAIANNFVSNNNFTQLFAGKYKPAIKDSKGCQFGKDVELIQPTELKINPVYKDTITCFGEKNGSILIEAKGGTPGYTFAMNNENVYDINDTFKNLGVGKYAFFVRDSKQCLKQTELLITEPDRLDLNLTSQTNPLCIGEKNGTITLQAKGGNNGGYTYTMDNSLKQFNNGLFKDLSEGDFTFRVEDRKACFDTVTLVKLKWPKALAASMIQKQPVCFGDANGQISIEAKGGVGGFKAEMVNQNIVFYDRTQPIENTFTFDKLPAGTYQFEVKDRNGCQLSLVERIADAVKLESNINLGGDLRTADSVVVCKGQSVILDAKNPGKEIEWYKDGNEIKEFRNQNIIESSQSAIYKVIVKNNTGCEIIDEFKFSNNNVILKTDFLIPSQAIAGDTVILLDQTFPQPDINTWLIPSEIKILEKSNANISLIFNDEKSYRIGLQAKKDNCTIVKYYDIDIFNENHAANTKPEVNLLGDEIILDFKIAPNPNYGSFSIYYRLKFPMIVNLALTSAQNGTILWRDKSDAKKEGIIDVKINNYMPGIFNLTLNTGNAQKTIKILLMR